MLLMANFGRAFSYLIAAQVQAVSLIFFAYWAGKWLNEHHPVAFSWYIVTFVIAVLGVAQTFYVVIKSAMSKGDKGDDAT